MGNGNGCVGKIAVVIVTMVAGFWGYFSTVIPSNTQSGEESFLFKLADDGVQYSFVETFNCQFIIAGSVEFLDENATDSENVVIMLQPLATYDDRPAGTAFIGSDGSYGLILVGNYSYLVWVHDVTLDMSLSEEILVDNLDCSERTQATLNFQQILPFFHMP